MATFDDSYQKALAAARSSGITRKVSAATIAAHYKAHGISRNAAWGQFVRDTILQPIFTSDSIDASEFFRLYDKS
jgi:hypothetical protein